MATMTPDELLAELDDLARELVRTGDLTERGRVRLLTALSHADPVAFMD